MNDSDSELVKHYNIQTAYFCNLASVHNKQGHTN